MTSIVMNTMKNGRSKRYAARYWFRFVGLVRRRVTADFLVVRSTVRVGAFDTVTPLMNQSGAGCGRPPRCDGRPVRYYSTVKPWASA